MAIPEQVELLRQGADVWNQWRAQHRDVVIDLSETDLSETDLSETDLRGADLYRAKLHMANLGKADLTGADLSEAELIGADLSASNLSEADFNHAILYGAMLYRAILYRTDLSVTILMRANLSEADLSETDLTGAVAGDTHFANIDLRGTKGLETIRHEGPSHISTSTLEKSEGDIPEAFLRGAGLSDTFIQYVHALVSHPIQYYTCFLSYSSKDQDFAERLHTNLQNQGIRCWYAPHELKPGDYYRHKIDESIRVYDKLILILSSHSVESEWVEKEVDIALKKEESMDMTRHVLFPIRLDNAALQSRRAWVRSLRFHRHIGDFMGWKDHDTYQAAFERLLSDLKAESVKKSE